MNTAQLNINWKSATPKWQLQLSVVVRHNAYKPGSFRPGRTGDVLLDIGERVGG